MNNASLTALVAAEIEALHVEFELWFGGESKTLSRVESVLAADFHLVSPRGDIVALDDLLAGLRAARNSRHISIRIEQPAVLWHDSTTVLATYQEWHDHTDYSTARQTTVLFSLDDAAPGGLQWRHVHETWIMPPPTWVVPPPNG